MDYILRSQGKQGMAQRRSLGIGGRATAIPTTLADASKYKECMVSVYAVVVSVVGPTKTASTDYSLRVMLTDPSLPAGDAFPCVMFGSLERLPQFGPPGTHEILHVHQAKVREYQANGETQLLMRIKPYSTPQAGDTFGYYPGVSSGSSAIGAGPSGLLHPGGVAAGLGAAGGAGPGGSAPGGMGPANLTAVPAGWEPIRMSHQRNDLPKADRGQLDHLRRWLLQRALEQPPQPPPPQRPDTGLHPGLGPEPEDRHRRLLPLGALRPPADMHGQLRTPPERGPAVDIIAKVLALDFRFHPRHVVLHVWDGTDAFPVPPTYTNLHAPPPPGPSHRGRPPQQQQSRQQETGEPWSKRQRVGDGDGGDGSGSGDGPEPPGPYGVPLPMPLNTFVQCKPRQGQATGRAQGSEEGAGGLQAAGGDRGGGAGEDGGASGGEAHEWVAVSVAQRSADMPLAGSAVPVIMPVDRQGPGRGPGDSRNGAAEAEAEQQQQQQPQTQYLGELPRVGEWIKLRNVWPVYVQGQLQLLFDARSTMAHRPSSGPQQQQQQPGKPGTRGGGGGGGGERAEVAYAERLAAASGGGAAAAAALHTWAPQDPAALMARPLRPAQHLPLRTLRQLLLQADTCDCSPARVIARVTGVVPGLHGPTGRPEGAAAPGGAGASAAAITAAVVWPADNLKLQDELAGPLDRGGNGRTYVMGLQLQDATGSLRAVALGGAANLLLWDLPPPPPAQGAQQQQQQNGPRQGPDGSGPGAGLVGSQGGVLKWISKQEPQSQGQGQGAGEQGQGAGEQGQKAGEQGPRRTRGAQRDQEREEAEDERARQTLQTVLTRLCDQGAAKGSWLEVVLRPAYWDRANPWQTAVFLLEHSVLAMPRCKGPRPEGEQAAGC